MMTASESTRTIEKTLELPRMGPQLPLAPLPEEARRQAAEALAGAPLVRAAFERLDVRHRNVEWFAGLDELERQRAVWPLVAALWHPSPDVQLRALRALARVADPAVVAPLLTYAESMALFVEGSERATLHGLLHEALAETLSALTGVPVSLQGQDPDGLLRGIAAWRRASSM